MCVETWRESELNDEWPLAKQCCIDNRCKLDKPHANITKCEQWADQ
jgi:hypothetical protein